LDLPGTAACPWEGSVQAHRICQFVEERGINCPSAVARSVWSGRCAASTVLSSTPFDSPSGCPQWEVPRVGTPAPVRCMQLGHTGEAEWRPDASS
jgi:hypothetical protein